MSQIKYACFTTFNLNIDWENINIKEIDPKNKIKYLIIQGNYVKMVKNIFKDM